MPVTIRTVRVLLLLALALPASDPDRRTAVDQTATAFARAFRRELERRQGVPRRQLPSPLRANA